MDRYRRSILDRESERWRTMDPEAAALVEAYERELRRQGLIDFDDMPLLALRAFCQHVAATRHLGEVSGSRRGRISGSGHGAAPDGDAASASAPGSGCSRLAMWTNRSMDSPAQMRRC